MKVKNVVYMGLVGTQDQYPPRYPLDAKPRGFGLDLAWEFSKEGLWSKEMEMRGYTVVR